MICSLLEKMEHVSLHNSPQIKKYNKLLHLGQNFLFLPMEKAIVSLSKAHGSPFNVLFLNPLIRLYAYKIVIYLPG